MINSSEQQSHTSGYFGLPSTDFLTGPGFHCETDVEFLMRRSFLMNVADDSVVTRDKFGIEISGIDFLKVVGEAIYLATNTIAKIYGINPTHYVLEAPGKIQAHIFLNGDKQLTKETRGHFVVDLAGVVDAVIAIRDTLQNLYGAGKLATINWWFMRGIDRTDCRSIVMEPTKPVFDEFYPFLGEPVEAFLNRYMADNASILFLMGAPGTGKTSLIRHLLYTRRLNASMTYDEGLFERDGLFVDFLTDSENNVLVIEDADTMLGARETEGNKLISRFLNVSDGLIKLAQKKIIFTTNLGDFSKIDHALVRAGRCFGAVKFRALLPLEARAAAKVAGIKAPDRTDNNVTLAELFNPLQGLTPLVSTIGF